MVYLLLYVTESMVARIRPND